MTKSSPEVCLIALYGQYYKRLGSGAVVRASVVDEDITIQLVHLSPSERRLHIPIKKVDPGTELQPVENHAPALCRHSMKRLLSFLLFALFNQQILLPGRLKEMT